MRRHAVCAFLQTHLPIPTPTSNCFEYFGQAFLKLYHLKIFYLLTVDVESYCCP